MKKEDKEDIAKKMFNLIFDHIISVFKEYKDKVDNVIKFEIMANVFFNLWGNILTAEEINDYKLIAKLHYTMLEGSFKYGDKIVKGIIAHKKGENVLKDFLRELEKLINENPISGTLEENKISTKH